MVGEATILVVCSCFFRFLTDLQQLLVLARTVADEDEDKMMMMRVMLNKVWKKVGFLKGPEGPAEACFASSSSKTSF